MNISLCSHRLDGYKYVYCDGCLVSTDCSIIVVYLFRMPHFSDALVGRNVVKSSIL
jgi:hypothetical protein